MGIFSMFDYSFTPPSNLDSMATLPVPSEDSQPRSEFTDFNHQHESPSIHPKSPPALPQDRVPTELLVMIFNHLLRPIPLPLSKPPRSSLRQPDLISVMRTCKLWESVAEPLTYRHIATDRFAGLLLNIHLPSMRRRLAYTKSLHLEYLPSGLEPSYACILRSGGDGWSICGRMEKDDRYNDSRVFAECRLEADDMELSLRQAVSLGMKEVFPRLERIGVGSLYGQSETWDRFDGGRNGPEPEDAIPLPSVCCMRVFNSFLATGSLKHLCIRSSSGPLTLPLVSYESQQPTTFTKTIHFGYNLTDNLHLPLGTPVRWVSDIRPGGDWGQTLYEFSGCVQRLIQQRSADVRSKGRLADAADVEIYCSTNHLEPGAFYYKMDAFGIGPASGVTRHQWKYSTVFDYDDDEAVGYTLSNMQQKRIASHLDSAVQQRFRRSGNKLDSVRWRLSSLTPICEACGSGTVDGGKV